MSKKYKILSLFLFGIISLLLTGFTEVQAATLKEEKVPDVWYTRRGGGKPYMSAQYSLYSMDGKVVYCIEPGVDITTHDYSGAVGWINSPYSTEINQKIQLIGYYGYNYPGHQTLRYRMATQALIWETTGGQIIEYWTEASGWGDHINVNYERNQIMNLVNAHYNKPSFDGQQKTGVIGQQLTFTDTSGVLSEYEIYKSDNATSSISGNTLYVTPNTAGDISVSLVRKSYTSDPTQIFVGNDGKSQKMGLFGLNDPLIVTVNIKALGGKIKLTKVDSELDITTAQGQASLIGAKYNVIDSNNNIITTLTIGNDMTATTDHLPFGTYTIKEISPSTGYYLDTNTYSITVNSSDTYNLTVEEQVIKGKIKVVKYDSETNTCQASGMASLVGAKYEIRDHNGNVVDTITIGNDCSATSKELPYGNYSIKEKSASTGYYLDSNTYYANIKDNNTISVTSKEDVIKGRIQINKVDSETNSCKAQGQATLVGAKFVIKDHNGNIVDTVTIGNDCNGISKYIPYGNYTIEELSSSKGYYINTEVFNQFVSEKLDYSIKVEEEVIKNYISILKQYDYVNGNTTFLNAEANITFEIFYPDGTKYGEITTDKNGYASLEIPYGVWKFHQVNSSTGFEKIYDFFVTVDENSEKEQYYNILNNKISAYLQVVKIDSETGKTIALPNTKFKILNTDTNQYVSQYVAGKVYNTFSTDESGMFTTYLKLEAGNYKLVEIESPKGYVLDSEGLSFSIGENTEYNYTTYGAFVVVNFENKPIKGQVEIFKNGEKFVVEDGSFKYETIALDGVKYELYAAEDIKSSDNNYIYYNKGDLVETLITDKFGYSISRKLPLGKYYLVEVQTKDNYVLDTKEYHFELTEKDNKTAIVYNTYKPYNYLMKGTLEFTKTDLVSGEVIPNVKLEVYTENEELIFSGITDKNGKIVIEELKAGKYYIIETDPVEGYVLNEEKVYFEIKENGEVVKATMTNKKITSTLKITKVNEEEKVLSGVKFGIYDLEDKLIKEVNSNEEGYIEIELEYGKYYFKEIATLDNYVLNDNKHYFEVKNDGEIISETIINEFIRGTLEFTKTDLVSGEVIPNVKLEIYNENDELIFSGLTDENGKVVIEELKVGKYYIVEIDPVEGYVLNEEKVYFEIKENGEVVKAEMTNKKITSTLKITKVNEEEKVLSGVKFGIYDLEDNLLFEKETDANGYIEIELEYGKYYFKEISTLEGYVLNEEKIYFEVTEDGAIIEETIINENIEGSFELTKVDFATGELIPNALIEIFNEAGELVFSGRTDENGVIVVEGLKYGKYSYVEKEAPEGYILNEEIHYFEILEDGTIIKDTLTNEKEIIEIPNTLANFDTIYIPIIILASGIVLLIITKKKKDK